MMGGSPLGEAVKASTERFSNVWRTFFFEFVLLLF